MEKERQGGHGVHLPSPHLPHEDPPPPHLPQEDLTSMEVVLPLSISIAIVGFSRNF